MLEVRLIGKFDIQRDGKPVTISSRSAQSLFAYLILNAGTLFRREKLAGMFWPEASEEKSRAYLRHELWRIRKALSSTLNSDYFLADDISIGFNSSVEYWLDVVVLKDAAETVEGLVNALSLFQGEFLPGFYEEWIILERENLLVVFEQKTKRLLELLEKKKRWSDVLEWAERWISFGQAPESAYRALLVAYNALGDHVKVAATYERCVQALNSLELEPSEETRSLATRRSSKINLPIPLSSFIGREKELKEVASLLTKSRLVTLTGSGGVGKTRLAIQVVGDVMDQFPDGVWFLDLATLSDPALVPTTLANLLGVRESVEIPVIDLLINYFRSRTALVIFDNCEHLIEACARLINSLLTACEQLSILSTSREALRVAGETPYRVPSLEVPKTDVELNLEKLSAMESVKLFVERVAGLSSGFVLTRQNALAIAQICQRLDGIPLAIELAAARVNTLTVEQISKRLDDRFNLLTHGLRSSMPRHQTLHAMIEWSYELLSEEERLLFRRLGVFAGGWMLEAAESVCADGSIKTSEILDVLEHLINKSMIIPVKIQRECRYRMLETIRQYADKKLLEAREIDALRDRHLEYFLNLAESAAPHLMRAEQLEWLPLLDADYENLRLAFDWSLRKETAELSLRLCTALGWFWEIRCYWLEGLNWLTRALAKPVDGRSDRVKTARSRALYTGAMLEYQLGHHFELILTFAEESLALALEVSDKRDIAIARFFLGVALLQRGEDYDQAGTLMEQSFIEFQKLEDLFWQAYSFTRIGSFLVTHRRLTYRELSLRSVEIAQKAGDRLILADTLTAHADWLIRVGRMDEGRECAEESDRLYKQLGSEQGSINSLLFAEIAWLDGDYEEAKSLCMEMYERFSLLGEKGYISNCIERLGILAMEEGDLDRARVFFEKGLLLEREGGGKPFVAIYQAELSNLFYLQGRLEEFKQNVRESLVLKNYLNQSHKILILMTVLGSLYLERPECAARLLGVVDIHDEEFTYLRAPIEKRYCSRAETHARKMLGETAFLSAFVEGQGMSLDQGLDLALRTVEEM
jgi:predicted ATPase/DNA-binding SARP family transcriptional activator